MPGLEKADIPELMTLPSNAFKQMQFKLLLCSPLSSQSFTTFPSSRGHHNDNEILWKGTHACVSKVSGTNLAQTHLQWQLIPRH